MKGVRLNFRIHRYCIPVDTSLVARSMLLVRFHDIRSAIRAMTWLRKETPFSGVDYFYMHTPPSPILSIQLVPCDAGEGLGHLIQSLTQNSSYHTYYYHVTRMYQCHMLSGFLSFQTDALFR